MTIERWKFIANSGGLVSLMMENTVNMSSSTRTASKKPIEKKPFLKRGSRKEPSALQRINKNKEKGIVSPPQLSSSSASSPSLSSHKIQAGDSGLSKKEWDASWAPVSTSSQRDIPVQVYSKPDSNENRALSGPSNLGKVRNSNEFVHAPTNVGKVRNSDEFGTAKAYDRSSAPNLRQTEIEHDVATSEMDMDCTNNSSDTSGDNVNADIISSRANNDRMNRGSSGDSMDELDEFAELERALEEIDSPEPSYCRNDSNHINTGDFRSSRPETDIVHAELHEAFEAAEKSILKSSTKSLPVHTPMSAMFGGDDRQDDEEASSTEYTAVRGFDQYITGGAVRSKAGSQRPEGMSGRDTNYKVSEFDFNKMQHSEYISSDDEDLSPNDSGVSHAQFVPTFEETSSAHQAAPSVRKEQSPSSWGPAVSFTSEPSDSKATRPKVDSIMASSSSSTKGASSINSCDDLSIIDVGSQYDDYDRDDMDMNEPSWRRDDFSSSLNPPHQLHRDSKFNEFIPGASSLGENGRRDSYRDQYEQRMHRGSNDYDDCSDSYFQESDVVPRTLGSNSNRNSSTRPTQAVLRSRPRIGKKIPQPPRNSMANSTINVRGASPNKQQPQHSQRPNTTSIRSNQAPPQRAESPGNLTANLSEKAKELEAELELYRSENAALRKSRIHQENTLADMKQQQSEIAKWSAEERRKTEEYCEEQRQAAARERRTAAKQAREQREREQISIRKDRQEIENLQNTVEKLKADLDKTQKKSRATERRLTQCLKDANEEREQLEKTVLNLEQEKVDIWNLLETFTHEGINVVNPLRKKLAQLRAKRNTQKSNAEMNADEVKKARKTLQATSQQQRSARSQRAPGSSYIEEVVFDDSSTYGYHGEVAVNNQVESKEVIENLIPTNSANPPSTVMNHDNDFYHDSYHERQGPQQQTREIEINANFLPKSVAFEPQAASITPVISTVYQPSTNGPIRERASVEAVEGRVADVGRALPLNFSDSNVNPALNSQRSSRGSRYSDSQDDGDSFDIRVATSGRNVDTREETVKSDTINSSNYLQNHQIQQQRLQQRQVTKERQPSTSSARQESWSTSTTKQEAWPVDATDESSATQPNESQSAATTTRSIETTPEGGKIVKYRNGTVKEVRPDGMVEVRFRNGDVKRTLPDKKIVVYYYREAKTKHTTFHDGLEVYEFPNGQVEKHFSDGSKEIFFPDNTRKVIHVDGTHESVFPDGVIVREYANDQSGLQEIITPDGQVRHEYIDV